MPTAAGLPTLRAMQIMAISDRPLFEHLMKQIGLDVVGMVNTDPLQKETQVESVEAIASVITENRHDFVELNPELAAIKKAAEKLGYIVAVNEEVMAEKAPAGWSGTVKAMKKHKEIDNPFALAHHMAKKGAKPHYKPEKRK